MFLVCIYVSPENRQHSNEWFVDSGASSHMTPKKGWLKEVNSSSISEIVPENNEQMTVNGVGNATLRICEKDIDVENVLFVPNLATNLLSVAHIVEKRNSVVFDKNGCRIMKDNGELLAKTKNTSGVYKFNDQTVFCNQYLVLEPPSWTHELCGFMQIKERRCKGHYV